MPSPDAGAAAAYTLRVDHFFVHLPPVSPMLLRMAGLPQLPRVRYALCTRDPGRVHVLGSHHALTGKRADAILAALGQAGQRIGRDWESHHVVERQHYAGICFEDIPFGWMYEQVLPCVLIPTFEHEEYYNRIIRTREVRALGWHTGTGRWEQRAAKAQEEYKAATQGRDRAKHAELLARVDALAEAYDNVYHDDRALRRVAANVFARSRERLRA